LVTVTRNVDGRHFAGRLPTVGDNLQRIRPAISPPAATSGVFEDGWRRVHPGKKRGGVFCPFGSRAINQARRRHLRIPTSLANQRAFINIKFSENVPVALADATIEFDFYMDHYFGERKAHEEGSSCFLRRRRNGHDCSLRTDTG
jgi:hypothetical protein